MGRLTLNVLLSFAQFEREVTGERIRDKIAASKRKGLWMGGPVPLGYEVVERKLVPTYGSNGVKRYTYYVTRKDLARKSDPKPTRFRRGQIENQVVNELVALLNDEHLLRRMSGATEGETLHSLFERGRWLAQELARSERAQAALRSFVTAVHVGKQDMQLELQPAALGNDAPASWSHTIPLPASGRPFREAKLKIEAKRNDDRYDADLIALMAEAMEVQRLVLQSPELSLNQLGKREGRCRTHLARLLRLSWISPKIVEAIAAGAQPKTLTRRVLMSALIPLAWDEQEREFGLAV